MLVRKLFRDMLKHKVQFISIFLMSFLGVYIFSGMAAEWMGLRENLNTYINETNFADMWIIGRNFSPEDVKKVSSLGGVNTVERRLVVDATTDLKNNPTLRLNFTEENRVSSCRTISGEDFSPGKDGIWINNYFAAAHCLHVGDKLTIHLSGLSFDKEIKGIVINPEYIYTIKDGSQFIPDNLAFGFAFLPALSFPQGVPIQYNQLVVDYSNSTGIDSIGDRVQAVFGNESSVVITRNSQTSFVYIDSEIKSHQNMGNLFPFVFLLISFLAVMTSMIRISIRQRTQIGTLKACGFSDRKVAMHYISYGIWISLAGSIAGIILGPATVPPLVYSSLDDYFALPVYKSHISPEILAIVAFSVLASALASYLACRKELRDPPALTLKPLAPKMKKISKFERSRFWRNLGFSVQWNFRDIKRNKTRSIMGAVSVAGSMMLLLCAFGMKDAVAGISEMSYNKLLLYNSKILLASSAVPEKIEDIRLKYHGQLIEEKPIEIIAGGRNKVASLTVLDEGDFIRFQNKNGDYIPLSDSGIAVTYRMAEILDVNLGDKISWHVYGDDNWQTTVISQLYSSPTDQGISMNRGAYENLGCSFRATSVLTGETVDKNLKSDAIEVVQTKSSILENLDKQLQFMNIIIGVLVAGAVMLGIVMIYNLGIISITEKTGEISILKVLGFKTMKIRNLLQSQNLWITASGVALGIPAGLQLVNSIIDAAGESFDFRVSISTSSWLICIAGMFLLSALVNYFLSRKVGTIDLVENLKGLE